MSNKPDPKKKNDHKHGVYSLLHADDKHI